MLIRTISSLAQRHPTIDFALRPAVALRRRWQKMANASADQVLDRLADLLEEDPIVRVDEFDGIFALSPRSALLRRVVGHGEYDPELTRKCIELVDPKRDVMDVGANIGFHTVLFAKRLAGRRVLAVEPAQNALKRLRRNIALNDVGANTVVFEGAVSNSVGALEIKTIAGQEEYSSLGVMEHPLIAGAPFVTERVETRPLDLLVADHGLDCGFIKVDVEGFEHQVFESGRRTLAEHRPVVLSELSDYLLRKNGASAGEVVRFVEGLDYIVFDPLYPTEKPGFRKFGDILCLPREHPMARSR